MMAPKAVAMWPIGANQTYTMKVGEWFADLLVHTGWIPGQGFGTHDRGSIAPVEQAVSHILKTMWALCEVVEEEKIWSPRFDSFDESKASFPFRHRIDMMLKSYEVSIYSFLFCVF